MADEVLERLVRVEERLMALDEKMDAALVQIQGPPRKESLRGRMHNLETNNAAARAAEAALKAVTVLQANGRKQRLATIGTSTAVGALAVALAELFLK